MKHLPAVLVGCALLAVSQPLTAQTHLLEWGLGRVDSSLPSTRGFLRIGAGSDRFLVQRADGRIATWGYSPEGVADEAGDIGRD